MLFSIIWNNEIVALTVTIQIAKKFTVGDIGLLEKDSFQRIKQNLAGSKCYLKAFERKHPFGDNLWAFSTLINIWR